MKSGQNSPVRFIATSPGLSATRWLAHVLASNPKVYVAHGHFPHNSVVPDRFAHERKTGDSESLTVGTTLNDYYRTRTLREVFADYRTVKPGALAYGNIHSYRLDTLMQRVEAPEDLRDIRVVNVLRHPVSYIDSHYSLVRSAEAHAHLYRHYVENMFSSALQEFPELFLIDCPNYREFIAFAVSCFSVYEMARDFQHRGFQHFQMESLTSKAVVLREFCETLTALEYPLEMLEEFIRSGPINRHRKQNANTDALSIYSAWPNWKQDIAFVIIPKTVLEMFEHEGYDIEMLREAKASAAGNFSARVPCLSDRLEEMDRPHPLLRAQNGMKEREKAGSRFMTPEIVDTHRGFNIVAFKDSVYGLRQSLGPVDLSLTTSQLLDRYDKRDLLIAKSAVEIAMLIDSVEATKA